MLYLLSLIFLSVCGSEGRIDSGCSRTIDVHQQESGVVYEYIRGDETHCAYEFRAKEGQRIMLSISHIGLLPRNGNEECIPKISIAALLFTGEERTKVSLCNAEDVKMKGSYVTAAKSARIEFTGPSDADGILLILFWFVQDVTLIPKVPEPPKQVTNPTEPIITLECPSWGADLDLDSCVCVEYDTKKMTNLAPPFCLIETQTLTTKCLREVSDVRHRLATHMFGINEGGLPPTCDDKGNYNTLQCDGDLSEPCRCVDPVSGERTGLMPSDCEFPITTTTEMTLTTLEVVASPVKICNLYACQAYCPHGQAKDESGCPTCDCKEVLKSATSETCAVTASNTVNEIIERNEQAIKTAPYPWLPDCSDDGNFKSRQCNYQAGCFCVDQESGVPNGRKTPDCGSYKDCVMKRIAALYRGIRNAGHRKPAKLVRGLLTGDDANDIQLAMDMLSQEERDSILSNPATHIPSCNDYGDYEALQCRVAEGTCWCVDVRGDVIGGSDGSSAVPDCSIYNRQVSPVPVGTDEKQSISVALNDFVILYCDFTNISESDDMHIFWTHNGVPVSSFNDERYTTGDVFYSYPTATSWLKIEPVLEEDVGSYGCDIADTSSDYFYKSEPHIVTVWNRNRNEETCVIQECDKYCGMGHKTNQHRCRICECLQREEIPLVSGMYQMQREINQPFGTHDGRCEAKRQLTKKQLLELADDQYMDVENIDNIPQCDADGNYQQIQNMEYFGRVCVDKMSGQASGRVVPDCDEWTPCIELASRATESVVAFFTNESTAQEVYTAATQARTLGERFSILDQAFFDNVPIEYLGDRTGLPPIVRCDSNTGLFWISTPVCSPTSSECWCVDENGEELEGTRSGVNETMPPCRDYRPAQPGPNMLNTEDSEINTEIGSTLTLQCDVSSYSPDTYVRWTTPSGATLEQMVAIDDRYQQVGDQVTDFAMRITNIKENEDGIYECNLYNYQSTFDKKEYRVFIN